jgi:peptidoglycan/LPS O-acetylase OafA/YrhL
LKFEVLSYLLLLWFWVAFRKIQPVAIALFLLAVASAAFPAIYKGIPGVSYTLPYFAAGVVMYVVYQGIGFNPYFAAGAAALLLIVAASGFQRVAYVVFGSYLITFLGSKTTFGSTLVARPGDLSYGVYLFGWPIQQLTKSYTGTTSPWMLLAVSTPLVLVFAAISCHLVERPALKLSQPIASFIRRMLSLGDPLRARAVHVFATLAFLFAAAAILTSEKHWWFITRSIAEMTVGSAIGAAFGLLAASTWVLWLRFCAIGQRGQE